MNILRNLIMSAVITACIVLPTFAQVPAEGTVTYPEAYYSFRDNMYNSRGKTAAEFEAEYNALVEEINNTKTGNEKQVLIARCDYVLGRAYRYLGLEDKATKYFDKGIDTCKAILKNSEMAEAYVVYADCVSQNCSIKPKTYSLSQGPKIKSMAKKALEIDPTYGAAMYLYNSQNIFTPAPFNDYKEGMEILNRLLDTDEFRMDKSDLYNAMSARAYCYLQQGKKTESDYWYEKALEIYPKNEAVLSQMGR